MEAQHNLHKQACGSFAKCHIRAAETHGQQQQLLLLCTQPATCKPPAGATGLTASSAIDMLLSLTVTHSTTTLYARECAGVCTQLGMAQHGTVQHRRSHMLIRTRVNPLTTASPGHSVPGCATDKNNKPGVQERPLCWCQAAAAAGNKQTLGQHRRCMCAPV